MYLVDVDIEELEELADFTNHVRGETLDAEDGHAFLEPTPLFGDHLVFPLANELAQIDVAIVSPPPCRVKRGRVSSNVNPSRWYPVKVLL